MFINGDETMENKWNKKSINGTAYNRLIAIGMTQGWKKEQFQEATEIFAQEVGKANLPKKLTGENGLLGGVQMDKIAYTQRAFNARDQYEEGYEDGQTPLERAKEKYPDNQIKQFIYAINIRHASLYRWVREDPKKTKSENASNAAGEFTTSFRPKATRTFN